MRKTSETQRKVLLLRGILALVLALFMALCLNSLSMGVSAATEGTVTASSANIRKEANPSSDIVGSTQRGKTVTINSEVQGTDGNIWYQIVVDANTTGYIRSDLVQKSGDTASAGGTSPTVNPSVAVQQVQPAGGTVTGGQQVRVRTDATTAGQIITTVGNGTAITVTGQATGTDGNIWYLVSFNANNAEVQGFIRSDFVSLSGELVPVDNTANEGGGTEEVPQEQPQEIQQKKDYDTILKDDGNWYLLDYTKGEEWDIVKLLNSYQETSDKLVASKKTVKNQKLIVIVLVILLIAAVLAATMLYFKVKDVMDEAYFAAVEKETLRERNAKKAQETRPRDPRDQGRIPAQPQGQAKPAGAQTRQAVPGKTASQNGAQVRSTAPGNAAAPGKVTAQRKAPVQGKAPVQTRSTSETMTARPVSQQGTQTKPATQARPAASNGAKPKPIAPAAAQQKPNPQPAAQVKPAAQPGKTKQDLRGADYANEGDDEFEFEFLNWDGEDEQ